MINLRKISEENFIDAFNLKLGHGQDKFVSHPIRSLAQAYVYRDQCQPFGIYDDDIFLKDGVNNPHRHQTVLFHNYC